MRDSDMGSRTFHDSTGEEHPERRRPRERNLPSWVDYGVISGVAGLIFAVGVQYNRLEEVNKRLDEMGVELKVIDESDSKPDIAVLKERAHEQDQQIADLKDTILRRLDRIETKVEERRR